MLRPFPACVRARVEPLDAHLLGLTVDRLNRATIGSDGQLVARTRRTHLLAAGRDEPNAGVSQQAGFVCGADGGVVADEPRPSRQGEGHLVERRQVVIRCGRSWTLTRAPFGARIRCKRQPNNRSSLAAQ